MKKNLFTLLLLQLFRLGTLINAQDTQDFTDLKGNYLGQTPPGDIPVVFVPGLISQDSQYEENITFSPDGNECYFTERAPDWSSSRVMKTVYHNGAWTKPERAPFSNDRTLSPSISPDGKWLYFSSNRGTDGKQAIWQCTRTTDQGWSAPVEMERPVSSTANEWSCHLSDLGNIFVCSYRGVS